MVDQSLISSVKKRDQSAFKKMYEFCIRYVYTIVKRYISNESDHQDVIQEIFARVFLSIDTYDSAKGDFKFWLRRIVVNQCLQHYRKNKKEALTVSMDSLTESDQRLDEQLTEMTKEDVEKYLFQMPGGYRQIFMMVVIDEYTHQEVADELGISPETSRSQLSRAKNWLHKQILIYSKEKMVENGL